MVSRSIAWKVALAFLAAGLAWVLLTDLILYRFVTDPVEIARLETAKGWAFVALGMVMMYVVVDRSVRRLARSNATISAVVSSISDAVLLLARDGSIAPVTQVVKLAATVGARQAVTFGGYLAPDAKGFPANAMAKSHAGDWRSPEQVGEFAAEVAATLTRA